MRGVITFSAGCNHKPYVDMGNALRMESRQNSIVLFAVAVGGNALCDAVLRRVVKCCECMWPSLVGHFGCRHGLFVEMFEQKSLNTVQVSSVCKKAGYKCFPKT